MEEVEWKRGDGKSQGVVLTFERTRVKQEVSRDIAQSLSSFD